jgi:amino acid transporter
MNDTTVMLMVGLGTFVVLITILGILATGTITSGMGIVLFLYTIVITARGWWHTKSDAPVKGKGF